MNRYRVNCAYDGTDFQGWQSQPNGHGVQDSIEASLESILEVFTRIHACSRTDSGVHARGQVFHFDASWVHSELALQRAISSKLPNNIQLLDLTLVSNKFHARFSALQKTYCYYIQRFPVSPFKQRWVWAIPENLDKNKMTLAAGLFQGTYDFTAFSANNGNTAKENPVKTISRITVVRLDESCLKITITGSGFLYKMVRSIVGVLVDIGRSRMNMENVPLWLEAGRRSPQLLIAPAKGLFLEKIDYK